MKMSLTILLLLVLAGAGYMTSAHPWPKDADQPAWQALNWHHRIIAFFAPQRDQYVEQFSQEIALLECQISERGILVLIFTQDGYAEPHGVLSDQQVEQLALHLEIPPDVHTGVLLNHHGQVQQRWGKLADWHAIMADLDALSSEQQTQRWFDNECAI
ncbi:DUF4174 domain-containing protein [Ferrimonas pelagia]|uniref:DUF4174 domain-containing protein n=1 Tax=Ferrimonas pelagia TaxID=1177826 RepID=A0ABP9EME5_9GAMM